ncbi:MAG: ferritin [Candidatus Saganbacteria bacterium]|nr:ferritin [Candidatus Saganbacteria bacterium]
MISNKLSGALNVQVNREIYSAYLYLSMASYFDSIGLKGGANWMKVQFQEEMVHATKIYDYLYARGSRALMLPIEAPESQWESPLAAFEHTLAHEKMVTGLINALVEMARSEKESDAEKFLQWFVKEQVEEEESAEKQVNNFKKAGGSKEKIAGLDALLGQRKFHG